MKKIGDLGEHLVKRWLQLQNYTVLQQNWRCRWGEIDLIAQDSHSKAIAFVEVKTRSINNWDADGLLAIDAKKQQKLLKTASLFLAAHPHLEVLPCRFDVGLVSYQSQLTAISHSVYESFIKTISLSQVEVNHPIAMDGAKLVLQSYLQNAFD